MSPSQVHPGLKARLTCNIGNYHKGELVTVVGTAVKGFFHHYVQCQLNGKHLWFQLEELCFDEDRTTCDEQQFPLLKKTG